MMANESFYINLGTMTQALKAEKILIGQNLKVTVGKSSRSGSQGGCSWGVWVKGVERERVINILRVNSIKVL